MLFLFSANLWACRSVVSGSDNDTKSLSYIEVLFSSSNNILRQTSMKNDDDDDDENESPNNDESKKLSYKNNEPRLVKVNNELSGSISDYELYSDKWLSKAMSEAETIRRLNFTEPVYFNTVLKSELKELYSEIDIYDTGFTEEEECNINAILTQFDYIKEGEDIFDIYRQSLAGSVGGFYLPERNTYYVVINENNTMPINLPINDRLDDLTAIHELTHALQDMNYDFDKLDKQILQDNSTTNEDASMALMSLIEGDATFTMFLFAVLDKIYSNKKHEKPSDKLIKTQLNLMKLFLGDFKAFDFSENGKIPPYLAKAWSFQYMAGAMFVLNLYMDGGYEEINKAFNKQLPVSTEQIIHYDKYKSKDEPEEIIIGDLTKSILSDTDWGLAEYNTLGEVNIYILLDQYRGRLRNNRVTKAHTGWDGDKYHYYLNSKSDDDFIVWLSAWDSEKDAGEFMNAYVSTLYNRKKGLKRNKYTKNEVIWTLNNNRKYAVYKDKTKILILEDVPENIFDKVLLEIR